MATTARAIAAPETHEQYSLARILSIWALAAGPMAVLSWIVFPAVSPDASTDPVGAGATRLALLSIGLVWLFVLSMIIVRQEEGDLRWATIKRRLRLNTPRDPTTGETRRRLWLWLIPLLVAAVVWSFALRSSVDGLWVSIFPSLAEPAGFGLGGIFGSQQLMDGLAGAWWLLALYVINAIFNTILGEEFLFRGVLLPKMEGAFSQWSWVANGVLFGFYHLHQPWGIAGSVISGVMLYAFVSWRFQSTWMGIIVHSAQSVYFTFLILGVVLGLA